MEVYKTKGYKIISDWLSSKGLHPFRFQEETWQHIMDVEIGLVNAPTGCGKTFSVFLGALIDFMNHHTGPDSYRDKKNAKIRRPPARLPDSGGDEPARRGLQLLWITPLRALAKDIGRAME